MALSLGIGKNQVISFNISEINIMKLVKLAGEMADIKALKNIEGADDILVFRDLKLYLSTGAKVFDVYYERGIHIKGKLLGNHLGPFITDQPECLTGSNCLV